MSGSQHQLKPEWLKISAPGGTNYLNIKQLVRSHGLHTVCEEAHCPNVAECWGGGTATLMLMGDVCTRACRFCQVKTGNPKGKLDPEEPQKVADTLSKMGLTYVVLTSVDRDDLPDGGADHFAKTVEALGDLCPRLRVEVLVPDFQGKRASIERLVDAKPDVVAQNIETVERLTRRVRDFRCGYDQTLDFLKAVKEIDCSRLTKSSIMVGLGETFEEVVQTMEDLRKVGIDIVTLGQYLRPSGWHLPVEEFIHPTVFKQYEEKARQMGFLYVASGPLVRSSYRAGELFIKGILESRDAQRGKR